LYEVFPSKLFLYPIFKFNQNRAYYFIATSSPVLPFFLFCSAVLCFMDHYDPNISLPESGNMRDIPKWHSQKAVWVPFFISIDMSVWITLKSVLEADAAKQLHFQKNTEVSSQEPSANTQATPKSADDMGTSIYWAFDPYLFFTFLHTSFSESDDGGADSSSGDDESGGRKSVSSHGARNVIG